MRNFPTEWRIKAPRNGRGEWTIVILTVDELGRHRIEAKGKTYDEAAKEAKKSRDQRDAKRALHMSQTAREWVELDQLSASNFNEEGG